MFLTWLVFPCLAIINAKAAPSGTNRTTSSYFQSPRYNSPLAIRCSFPCDCVSTSVAVCDDGSAPAEDACGCCVSCGFGEGSRCGRGARCLRGLTCRFPHRGAPDGICRVPNGLSCEIEDQVYHHGEFFTLDCRTQCACQNGTYACSSLCPQEHITPQSDACEHPRLVEVPGQCCREWMCDAPRIQKPPECPMTTNHWSPCSATCGGGISHQVSRDPKCPAGNATRICQEHNCLEPVLKDQTQYHHIRKIRACRATRRLGPSRLRIGRCSSTRPYNPRVCGRCGAGDKQCCAPALSTTVKVEMFCNYAEEHPDDIETLVFDQLKIDEDIWYPETVETEMKHQYVNGSNKGWHHAKLKRSIRRHGEQLQYINVEWIIKCDCGEEYCKKQEELRRREPILEEDNSGPIMIPTRSYEDGYLRRVHRTSLP